MRKRRGNMGTYMRDMWRKGGRRKKKTGSNRQNIGRRGQREE